LSKIRSAGAFVLAPLALLAVPAAFAAIVLQLVGSSDDFNGCGLLRPDWEIVDPVGGATAELVGGGTVDAHLRLLVPAGASHDAWFNNDSVRALQTVPDGDFLVTLALATLPSSTYHSQGLLVEDDEENWLRFDVYSTGSALRAFVAETVSGWSTVVANQPVTLTAPAWLRVTRVGTSWQYLVSDDGTSWSSIAAFESPQLVQRIGPFAGSAGSNPPAFDARFDFIEFDSDPILAEDQGPVGPYSVTVTAEGPAQGSVILDPPTGPYACGDTVHVTAVPAPGSNFSGWTGALAGAANPAIVTLRADLVGGASFDFDQPPVISELSVLTSPVAARVTWRTNEPATSEVRYGPDSSLGLVAGSASLVTEHDVLLTDLSPGSVYSFQVASVDEELQLTLSPLDTFATSVAGVFLSDDFNGCGTLAPNWSAVNPAGDATLALVDGGSGAAGLVIAVPGGSSHDAWNINGAPRAMQNAANGDFRAVLKLDVLPTQRYQMVGLIAQQDATNWLRFDLFHDGTGVRAFAASTVNGASQLVAVAPVALTAPAFVRVTRVGDQWTQDVSDNGESWTSIASFGRVLALSEIGPFAGNAGGSTAPAFAARFDFIEEESWPLLGEDTSSLSNFEVSAAVVGNGSGSVILDPATGPYPCDTLVSFEAVPAPGSRFIGWGGALSGQSNPTVVAISGDLVAFAEFDVIGPLAVTDVAVQTSPVAARITWLTSEPTFSEVHFGTDPGLGSVAFSAANGTAHEVILPGLTAGTTYYFQVVAVAVGGELAQSSLDVFDTGFGGALTSDDFNGCADPGPIWTSVDPAGDATFVLAGGGTPAAVLTIAVPGGADHDPWGALGAPRLMQGAANADFDVVVALDALPAARFQMEGFLAVQDAINWIRFDVYHDGTTLRSFAASTTAGVSRARANLPVALTAPAFLRVERSGSVWRHWVSDDRITWTQVSEFTMALGISEVGLFAGNAGGASAPPFTGRFDFLEEAEWPLIVEDAASVPAFDLIASTVGTGLGTISLDPSVGPYSCGTEVTVLAVPQQGSVFSGWSGVLAGSPNPALLLVTGELAFGATFDIDLPAAITNVNVVPASTTAIVQWTTDRPARGLVEFGPTPALGQEALVPDLDNNHAVLLTGLQPESEVYFTIHAETATGLTSSSGPNTFWTEASSHDDFYRANLGLAWEFVDALGVGTLRMETSMGEGCVRLEIPPGHDYDSWTTNRALRIRRPWADSDFDVALAMGGQFNSQHQMQGFIFESDDGIGFARFELVHDGVNLRAFAATNPGGAPAFRLDQLVWSGPYPNSEPRYIRVRRTGDLWEFWYSLSIDPNQPAVGWNPVGSFFFAQEIAHLALHVASTSALPGCSATFDWFTPIEEPIADEDGALAPDELPPLLYRVAHDPAQTDHVVFRWSTDEVAGGRVRYGLTPSLELGVAPVAGTGYNQATAVIGLLPNLIYHCQVESQDAHGFTTYSDPFVIETTGGIPPVIDIWNGIAQPDGSIRLDFGLHGQPEAWANVLGNAVDPDGNVVALEYILTTAGGTLSTGPLTIGPNGRRLVAPGDFNIDLLLTTLDPGLNEVLVRARDDEGLEALARVIVAYDPTPVWDFGPQVLTSGAPLHHLAQPVDGKWSSSVAGLRTLRLGYDRLLALGERSWSDYAVTGSFIVHFVEPPENLPQLSGEYPLVGLGLRWNGHTPTDTQPHWGFWPTGAFLWYAFDQGGNGHFEIWTNNFANTVQQFAPFVLGDRYWYRVTVEQSAAGVPQYTLSVWHSELFDPGTPPNYVLELEGQPGDPTNGSLLLIGHHVDVTFGDLTIQDLSGELDTEAPTAPVLTASSVLETSVQLDWTAATDNVGVVGYRVRRDGVLMQTLGSGSLSYLDADPALHPTTAHSYTVGAFDASGNEALSALLHVTIPDLTAPSVPGNLHGVPQSSTSIRLSWAPSTDNVAVAGYRIRRDGSPVATVGGATTQFTDEDLAPESSYLYAIQAFDGAGNESSFSAELLVVTSEPDVEAPTVPTAVIAVAQSSSSIQVQWAPSSDNVGVTSYHIFRDGSFVESTASGSQEFLDLELSPNTSYEYRVSALDASGNESEQSVAAFATTEAAPPDPSLFAAFGFEEGLGQKVLDSSGHDNDGVLRGATRVPGQYGEAIVGNGVVGSVDLGTLDAPAGLGMTIALWCRPQAFTNADARLVSKATGYNAADHFWMVSTLSNGRIHFRLHAGGSVASLATPTGTLAAGTWAHVAVTYDGVRMRIYQDGVLLADAAKTGSIDQGPTVRTLIGDAPGGNRAFNGVIDEVRFYDRALSSVELLDLMSTPIGAPAADGRAPSVPTDVVAVATATTRVDLHWSPSTDSRGVADYLIFRDGVQIASIAGTTYADSSVQAGATYSYEVVARDDAGNNSAASIAALVTTLTSDSDEWFDPAWSFRVPVVVDARDHRRFERPIEAAFDFTELLDALGASGSLDLGSLRVVEVNAAGQILNDDVPFQFDPDPSFDALLDARGELVVLGEGWQPGTATRYYHVYFGVNSTMSPAVVAPRIAVNANSFDEGMISYAVANELGTFHYQPDAGGFSSWLDLAGNDWISHMQGGGAGGQYRGIPNLAYPESLFHPGYAGSSSTIARQGPLLVEIHTESNSGAWECVWHIFPRYARLTVLRTGHPYWFLYEGTPGGNLDLFTDYCLRSDGTFTVLANAWNGDLVGEEWVLFGDPIADRELFVASHEADQAFDSYWQMEGLMTVFGFGRQGISPRLTAAPAHFTMGFIEAPDMDASSVQVRSAYHSIDVHLGAPAHQGAVQELPSTPGSVLAVAVSAQEVLVTWAESIDNVAIIAYDILRDGVPVAAVTTGTAFNDSGLVSGTYAYSVIAIDAQGNASSESAVAEVTLP
jgi:regulation of enolase protein 1 (concanavalin A-like superfamily)/chitodextrinase